MERLALLAALDCRPLMFFPPWRILRRCKGESRVSSGQGGWELALAPNKLYHQKTGLCSRTPPRSLVKRIPQDGVLFSQHAPS